MQTPPPTALSLHSPHLDHLQGTQTPRASAFPKNMPISVSSPPIPRQILPMPSPVVSTNSTVLDPQSPYPYLQPSDEILEVINESSYSHRSSVLEPEIPTIRTDDYSPSQPSDVVDTTKDDQLVDQFLNLSVIAEQEKDPKQAENNSIAFRSFIETLFHEIRTNKPISDSDLHAIVSLYESNKADPRYRTLKDFIYKEVIAYIGSLEHAALHDFGMNCERCYEHYFETPSDCSLSASDSPTAHLFLSALTLQGFEPSFFNDLDNLWHKCELVDPWNYSVTDNKTFDQFEHRVKQASEQMLSDACFDENIQNLILLVKHEKCSSSFYENFIKLLSSTVETYRRRPGSYRGNPSGKCALFEVMPLILERCGNALSCLVSYQQELRQYAEQMDRRKGPYNEDTRSSIRFWYSTRKRVLDYEKANPDIEVFLSPTEMTAVFGYDENGRKATPYFYNEEQRTSLYYRSVVKAFLNYFQ